MAFDPTVYSWAQQQRKADPPLNQLMADVEQLQRRINDEGKRGTAAAYIRNEVATPALADATERYAVNFGRRAATLEAAHQQRVATIKAAATPEPTAELARQGATTTRFRAMSTERLLKETTKLLEARETPQLSEYWCEALAVTLRERSQGIVADQVHAAMESLAIDQPWVRDREVQHVERQIARGAEARGGLYGLEIDRAGGRRVEHFPIRDLISLEGEAPAGAITGTNGREFHAMEPATVES